VWPRARLLLLSLLLCASCATTTPRESSPAGNFKVGVAFLGAGAGSIAIGAGLFGYALAHRPANEDTPNLKLFLPGVALFGIGIPFLVTGAIFTITGALSRQR
jgi:hypothetical protein